MLARISSVLARPALLVRARPAAEAVVAEGWRSFATAAPAALPRTRRAPEGRPLKLPEDLRPTLVDGKWRRPRVSHRRAAELRKAAILDGSFGTYDAATGRGWDPSWDTPRRATVMKPPKGRGGDRALPERLAKIQKNLDEQEKKIKDFKKTLPAKPAKTGLLVVMRKQPWEKE